MIPVPPPLDPNTTALKLFTLYLGIPLAVFVVVAVRRLVHRREPLLLLLLIGGLVSSPLETVLCHNGLCTYPGRGQWTAISAYGVHVPVSTVFAYCFWFGGFTYVLVRMMQTGTPAQRFWRLFWALAAATLFVEYPSLWWMEGHRYYGKQPFWIGGLPLWWSFVNPMAPFLIAAVATKLLPYLRGPRAAALMLVVPMTGAAAHAMAGFPVWIALHSDHGYAATYPAGILTVGLTLFVMSIVIDSSARNTSAQSRTGLSTSRPRS